MIGMLYVLLDFLFMIGLIPRARRWGNGEELDLCGNGYQGHAFLKRYFTSY